MSLIHDTDGRFYERIAKFLMWRYGYHVFTIQSHKEANRYRCDTNIGTVDLTYWEDIDVLKAASDSREALVKGRFRSVDRFIPGLDGQRFYSGEWNGIEVGVTICDHIEEFECLSDMESVGHIIGRMHTAMLSSPIEQHPVPFSKWNERFQLQIDQFIQARKKVEKVYVKTKADKMFLVNFYSVMQRARKALKILGETDYESIVEEAEQKLGWCHGDLDYKNIGKSSVLCVTGLNGGHADLIHYDIASFLQSLAIEKELSEQDVIRFFKGYEEIRSLKSGDIKIIFSYLLFPHVIWRNIYSFYLSQQSEDNETANGDAGEDNLLPLITSLRNQCNLERLYPIMTNVIFRKVAEEEALEQK